jgi:hypothetical protein
MQFRSFLVTSFSPFAASGIAPLAVRLPERGKIASLFARSKFLK